MIIYKIIPGFVTQCFDTKSRKFISQDFTAAHDHVWEYGGGAPLSLEDDELVYGKGGVDEPELFVNLVQPR